jgi:hypothetical protein
MRHTTSLRILEEGLLLKCLFNLEENFVSVEKVQKDKRLRTCSAMAIVYRGWRECRKLALLEDYFMLTTPKWAI